MTMAWRPWDVKERGIYLGENTETGQPVYWTQYATGLWAVGPPGVGKTKLITSIFSQATQMPNSAVVLFNHKGSLGRDCLAWAVARGLTKRTLWWDPADDMVPGWNPLRPNGLRIATHAKAVREGIRGATAQGGFDVMAQLGRLLFLACYIAREQEATLAEALRVLRPHSLYRREVLASIRDPYIREALQDFHDYRDQRQEELAASSVARLESLILDESIRGILTAERSLDIATVLREKKILIVNIEENRPLRTTDAKTLARLMLNDVVSHIFERDEAERTPVWIIADEAYFSLTADFCAALDRGRELGCRAVLANQYPSQFLREDPSGQLLASVKKCITTRLIFGGLEVEDLRPLVEEAFIDQVDLKAVKHEIRGLELEPVEETRESITIGMARSESESRAEGRSISRGRALADSESTGRGANVAVSRGKQTSRSESEALGQNAGVARGSGMQVSVARGSGKQVSHSRGRTRGTTEGESLEATEGHSESQGWAYTQAHGEHSSETEGESDQWAEAAGFAGSQSSSYAQGQTLDPDGRITFHTEYGRANSSGYNSSSVRGGGTSRARTTGQSDMEATTQSGSATDSRSISRGAQRSVSDSSTKSRTYGESATKSRTYGESRNLEESAGVSQTQTRGRSAGESEAEEHGRSASESRGTTRSESEEQGMSEERGASRGTTKSASRTIGPWHAFRKRRPVTSVQFWSEQEQLTLALQRVKAQPVGHFVVKATGHHARFLRAPFIKAVPLAPKALARALERIHAVPYCTPRGELEAAELARVERLQKAPPLATVAAEEDVWIKPVAAPVDAERVWTRRVVPSKRKK